MTAGLEGRMSGGSWCATALCRLDCRDSGANLQVAMRQTHLTGFANVSRECDAAPGFLPTGPNRIGSRGTRTRLDDLKLLIDADMQCNKAVWLGS